MCTYALVGAADFNAAHFESMLTREGFEGVVAIDRGYASLQEIGCEPTLVLGDFDSLGYVPEHPHLDVHPCRKDASDLELALDAVRAAQAQRVVAYGVLGGRLDHTLAALQTLMALAEEGVEVLAVGCSESDDGGLEGGYCVAFLVGPAQLELKPLHSNAHGVVSVFAACDCARGVSETGMRYPLSDFDLSNRTSLGLSNEFEGKPACVSVVQGSLYVMHPLSLSSRVARR